MLPSWNASPLHSTPNHFSTKSTTNKIDKESKYGDNIHIMDTCFNDRFLFDGSTISQLQYTILNRIKIMFDITFCLQMSLKSWIGLIRLKGEEII